MTATIQQRAAEGSAGMETATRPDGTEYTRRKEDAPHWLTELVHEAHGDMLPDDYRYEVIREALGAIHDASGDLDQAGTEFADEADVYNADLLRWVGSHSDRPGYVDEALSEYGEARDFYHGLQMGQYAERDEVYGLVLAFLRRMTEHADFDIARMPGEPCALPCEACGDSVAGGAS